MNTDTTTTAAAYASRSVLYDAYEYPVTFAIAITLIAVYLYLTFSPEAVANNRYADVLDSSYESVVRRGELYRVLTSTFTHLSLLHLAFNVNALWSMRGAEALLGAGTYVKDAAALTLGTEALALAFYYAAYRVRKDESFLHRSSVGYSGVLFGMMAIVSQLRDYRRVTVLGYRVPLALAPLGSLLLTQLLVPRASFVAHSAGVALGYALAFARGDWLNGWAVLGASAAYGAAAAWRMRRERSACSEWHASGWQPQQPQQQTQQQQRQQQQTRLLPA